MKSQNVITKKVLAPVVKEATAVVAEDVKPVVDDAKSAIAEPIKEEVKADDAMPEAKEDVKPSEGMCMCPTCNGAGEVKVEIKAEEPAKEEPKEDVKSAVAEPAKEDEKVEEDAPVKKEDAYAKGKALKNADLSHIFVKNYADAKQVAFGKKLDESFQITKYTEFGSFNVGDFVSVKK
jgi:hypothetical protein